MHWPQRPRGAAPENSWVRELEHGVAPRVNIRCSVIWVLGHGVPSMNLASPTMHTLTRNVPLKKDLVHFGGVCVMSEKSFGSASYLHMVSKASP